MRSRSFVVLIGSAAAGVLAFGGSALAQKPDVAKQAVSEGDSPARRKEAFGKAEDDRRQAIDISLSLIEHLKNEASERTKGSRLFFAVNKLGLLRAEEASTALLDIIDVRFLTMLIRIRAPEDPDVIQALARIGKPASKAAVEYLAKDKSSKRAPMYVRVIALVEGVEVGKFMVERAAAAESDPEKKARLTKAIALFADADKVVP